MAHETFVWLMSKTSLDFQIQGLITVMSSIRITLARAKDTYLCYLSFFYITSFVAILLYASSYHFILLRRYKMGPRL